MAEPLPSYELDLDLLRTAAVTAGIIASSYFRRDLKTWTKENASPVSEADIVLDKFLHSALTTARPQYGWLSEESADDHSRLSHSRTFVVDPIDGTRGFINGEDSWTVSLAVVEHGIPIAGVVYAPARDEMYDACLGGGARLNGQPILRRTPPDRHAPLIPAPGAVHQELQSAGLDYTRGPFYPSLAYRLVQIATGKLDATVVRRGSQDWDLAGAAAILAECGIAFEDACAGAMQFNRVDVRHGALAAFAQVSLRDVLCGALIKVYGCPEPQLDLERKVHDVKAPKKKEPAKQLLHLVIGGELESIEGITFKDLSKVDLVGVYPNYAEAQVVWKSKAQQTVDNAQMRYFVVHLHRLLDPEDDQ